MKLFKRINYFLGSAVFAVILIFLAAVMVAFGTYLESTTESHQVAAEMIYKSAFFKLLLIGFFINILVSALRRWPFQVKHAPFLITHLGLLMLIAGTFIKTIYGTQGNVVVVEGSNTNQIQLPEEMVISVVERDEKKTLTLPIKKNFRGQYELPPNQFCELLEFCPHSEEKIFSWIHDGKAYFYGHPPFLAYEWKSGQPMPTSNPLALITDAKQEAIHSIIAKGIKVEVQDTATGKTLGSLPLEAFLGQKVDFEGWSLYASLNECILEMHYENSDKKGCILLELTGPHALLNQHKAISFLGRAPITIDLVSKIPLSLIQDSNDNTTVLIADEFGRIYMQNFMPGQLHSYIAYNEGFDGYAVQAEFLGLKDSRKNLEEKIRKNIAQEIQGHLSEFLPLRLFNDACEASLCEFSESLVDFLDEWNKKGGWLYPETIPLSVKIAKIFRAFDWSQLVSEDLKSSLWLSYFFKDFDKALFKGDNFLALLRTRNWPLSSSIELLKDDEERLTLFSQQLFSLGQELPWIPFSQEPEMIARIFTAFLRIYGIHFSHIPLPNIPINTPIASFESPLLRKNTPLPSLLKLENNLPLVYLNIQNKEKLPLTFDRFKSAIKWPTKDGKYLLKFHSRIDELPYSIRLHKAKQLNYPESDQAFSYESELTFKDRRTNREIRKTISMNEVHETWDGYRFYLSGLSKGVSGAHMVQLVVNRDPAKYWLTYPGGVLIALGIVLLFWWRRPTPQ